MAADLGARLEQLTRLRRVYDELTGTLNIHSVITFALDATVRLSLADGGYIALEEDGQLRTAEYIGDYDRNFLDALLKQRDGIVGRVIRQRQSELITDVHIDPHYLAVAETAKSYMIFPLVTFNDKLVGGDGAGNVSAGTFFV